MASLTGNLVAETYKALLKTIDNDILTASEKQITDGFGGGSNIFIDSQGFIRANKYKITNGLATQFLKADGSLDTNTYLTSITGAQVITALGYTPVTNQRTLTINGVTYNLTANRTWTIEGTAAVWGNITGTLSNQTDLQNALNAKYNVPAGTITQYIRGDGSIANFPTLPGGLPIGGTAGQILSKIDATDYNAQWIDNFATQTKNEVKLAQTLTKGTAVYVSSANGTNMIVSAASNASEALSSKTFGLLETGGATNDLVKCVTFGLLAGLDTSAAQAGDPVWLGVNGALIFGLANKPVAPANMVYIGVVTRVQSNNGEIFVNIQNGFEIEELHDVLIQSKVNNQGLFYESLTGLWKNKSITDALGFVPQRVDNIASSLFASATNYPNNNAVIAGLALKADAANPVFTGSMNIVGLESRINFYDENNLRKYFIGYDSGTLRIFQDTGSASRFYITPTGQTFIPGTLTVGSVIKDGGTASQFLKADGSIDSNSYVQSSALADYLLISTAASTYQRLDRMSINLLASDINYPNNNAVINALALKADAANPVFTGFMTISGAEPRLYFVDTDNNPDYTVFIDSGIFYIYDQTAGATRFSIGTTGNINAGIGKSITAGSFIKDGGTASQFLKADGSIDSNTYVASSALADYLLISTATATYQRLDRLASSLFASATNYPNNNAVIAGLALKADAANPMFTGSMNITGIESRINFYDQNNIRQFFIGYSSGNLSIFQDAGSATRFQINSSGNITTGINNTITSWGFVKSGGTSSQFLMADGSVSTFAGITGSGTTNYLPKWTGASALGNSILTESANGIGIGIASANGVLQFSNSINSRKIVLYEGANNDFQFYGFGVNSATLVYSVYSLTDDHVFFAGASATTRNELLRIKGNGTLIAKNSSSVAGLSATVNATGEFMSTGSLAGYFWENRSGGVTTNSNWYGWYTTAGAVKLYNGGANILSIDGSSGSATFEGNVISKLFLGVSRDGSDTIGGGAYLVLSASSTSRQWIQQLTASNHLTYYHYNGGAWIQPVSYFASGNVGFSTSIDSGFRVDINGSLRINGVNPSITTDNTTDYTILNARKNGTRTWQIDSVSGAFWLYMQDVSSYVMQISGSETKISNNIYMTKGTDPRIYSGSGVGLNIDGYALYLNRYSQSNIIMCLNGGNIGIGTTVATALLTVAGTSDLAWSAPTSKLQISRSGTLARIQNYENGSAGNIALSWDGGNIFIGTQTDVGAKFRVHYDGGNGSTGLGSYNILATTPSTSSTYQATIGAIHPGDGYGNLNLGGNGVFWHISKRLSTDGHQLEFYYYNGSSFASRFIFSTSGNLTATAFFESSDMRLKKLIDHNPIVKGIENLQAKLYEKEGKIEIGYFAQDAELIMPYAVTKGSGGFLNLSYREVHTAKIAKLEQRVAELEKQLNLN